MGQGLYTKMVQIASQELNVPVDAVFTQDTASYHTANASPTAASSGSDLNGMAIKDACDQLNERLKPIREELGYDAPMSKIAHAAYLERINLNATGFWKMPSMRKSPFHLNVTMLNSYRNWLSVGELRYEYPGSNVLLLHTRSSLYRNRA